MTRRLRLLAMWALRVFSPSLGRIPSLRDALSGRPQPFPGLHEAFMAALEGRSQP